MADNVAMLERVLTIAAICAALASTGCPSLDALECHGTGCTDASAADGATVQRDASTIFCGASSCAPPAYECCFENAQTSCVSTDSCNGGSDIFCDDPSQCPDGGSCWICINGQGFQGTSCNYEGDIVGNWNCSKTNGALPLCHSTNQCSSGTTCRPLAVDGFDAGADESWFSACQ
jgi:hypothetical protein